MRTSNVRFAWAGAAVLLVTAFTVAGISAAPTGASSKKLVRQILVMESVIDRVLVDSPNLQVQSQSPTHGVYLDEFGVLFTVEAGLTHVEWGEWPFGRIKVVDGNVIVMGNDDDEDEDDEDHDEDAPGTPSSPDTPDTPTPRARDKANKDMLNAETQRDWVAKQAAEQEKRYEGGKDELRDALLDYGETLTALRDDQTVAIAAFINEPTLMEDRRGSRVVWKIKMSHLRAASAGTISAEELRKRLEVEEY